MARYLKLEYINIGRDIVNQIREIVTKAVVAKGKKKIGLKETIKPENTIYSILGCWVINHEFEATKDDQYVTIDGSFEVNIWYSLQNNSKTDVTRKRITYQEKIKTKQIVNDYIEDSDDIMARIVEHPTCTNAFIEDNVVHIDISLEILAEIIGETKMQVTVFQSDEIVGEEEDFENEINENFLNG